LTAWPELSNSNRDDSEQPANSVSSSRRRWRTWLACGVAVVLLAAAMAFAMGFIGVGSRRASTQYRSAVGAQNPILLSLDGVSIAYTDSGGAGPTVLCLHAIGHGARDFEDLSRRLSPDYRVIALDFPNQGNSGPDFKPASGTRYTEIVSQFIDRLNLTSVTLVGNSIGGAVAIRYASLHPERVKALVLCDSGGLGPPGAIGRVFITGFVQFFAAGRRGALWFPWAFSKYYSHVLREKPAQEEHDRIVRSAYEIAPTLEDAWRSFARPEENLFPVLPSIRCPVLMAWAKDDFVLPLQSNAAAFDRFPNHQVETFSGGHAAFLEDPEPFASALRSFLSGVYSSSGS
jgi:pimeloyl-ACP methyl ester carboxylesterase